MRFTSAVVLLGVALLVPSAGSGASLTFTPSSAPGSPFGLNTAGQIVGIFVGGETTSSYLYSQGVTLTISVPGAASTLAYGINDAGTIVGAVSTHAFLDVNGVITPFDAPGFVSTTARGINSFGQIVGYATDASGKATGFIDTDGHFTSISVPGSSSTYAYRITNSGEVVGYWTDATGQESGFIYKGGNFQIMNVPGSLDTLLYGANDVGQMVGSFVDSAGTHGFLYSDGVFTDFDAPDTLPTRGTFARDIDASGNILVYGTSTFIATAASAPVPEPPQATAVTLGACVIAVVLIGSRRLRLR
jgi:probable HAF family extracellular repeat protein